MYAARARTHTHTQTHTHTHTGTNLPFVLAAPYSCGRSVISGKRLFVTVDDVVPKQGRLLCIFQCILHPAFCVQVGQLRFLCWHTGVEIPVVVAVSNCLRCAGQSNLVTDGWGRGKRGIIYNVRDRCILSRRCATRPACSKLMHGIPCFYVALYPTGYSGLGHAYLPGNVAITEAHIVERDDR